MMRSALLAVGVFSSLLLVAAPAGAAPVAVDIQGMAFSPPVVKVAQGAAVRWTNHDAVEHTVTSNQAFWRERRLPSGASTRIVFDNAGRFAYHCAIHPSMTGAVRVPMKASGAATTGWHLRWSSLTTTPSNRSFDVQIKRPGATAWASFRTNVKARTAFFDPSRAGKYAFRARTRNLSDGMRSGWSPVRQVRIS